MKRTMCPGARGWWRAAVAGIVTGLWLPCLLQGAAPLVPEYQVGETARVDIVTPIQLVAIDPTATAELRLKEAQKIAPAYRLDSNVIEQVLLNLNEVLATNRAEFLARLDKAFPKTRLGDREMASAAFGNAINAIRRGSKGFPLTTNLAERWARRIPDDDIVGRYRAGLQAAMRAYIRAETLTEPEKLGARMGCFILPLTMPVADLTGVETNKILIAKTNLLALSRARQEFQRTFFPEERALGSYLAALIQPNCVFEEKLTVASRARRTESIWSASRYEPGGLVVRSGERITPKTKAALDALRSEVGQVRQEAHEAAARVSARWWQILWGTVGVMIAVFLLAIFLINRRVQGLALMSASTADLQTVSPMEKASPARELSPLPLNPAESLQVGEVVPVQTEDRLKACEERITQLETELEAAQADRQDSIRAELVVARRERESCRQSGRIRLN